MTRESIVEAGRQIVEHGGADLVIISHDVTGDVAVAKDAVWEIQSEIPTTELKNPVGADDIFLAGILFKLVQDEPLDQALRFGLAAGLASAESEEKICRDMARIEAEMQRVSVNRI